jgi:hypothetical protein
MDPDPSPFFSEFKDTNKKLSLRIFSFNLPAGTLSSVLKIVLKLYFASLISIRSTPL